MRYLALLQEVCAALDEIIQRPLLIHANPFGSYLPAPHKSKDIAKQTLQSLTTHISSFDKTQTAYDARLLFLQKLSDQLLSLRYQSLNNVKYRLHALTQHCKFSKESGFVDFMQNEQRLLNKPSETARFWLHSISINNTAIDIFDRLWTGQSQHPYMALKGIFSEKIRTSWPEAQSHSNELFKYYTFLRRALYHKECRLFPYPDAAHDNLLTYFRSLLPLFKYLHIEGLGAFSTQWVQALKKINILLSNNLISENGQVTPATYDSIHRCDNNNINWTIHPCDNGLGEVNSLYLECCYEYNQYANFLHPETRTGSTITTPCKGKITVCFELTSHQDSAKIIFPILKIEGFNERITDCIKTCWYQKPITARNHTFEQDQGAASVSSA